MNPIPLRVLHCILIAAGLTVAVGAMARQLGRAVTRLFVPAEQLPAFRQEDRALAHARAAVTRALSELA